MKNPIILVVDDDTSVLAALAGVLRSEGYDVVHATDGEEALARVCDHPGVELVLLDPGMPRMTGWKVVDRLRFSMPLLPVVIITAEPNQFQRAWTAGVDALLEKPLDIALLLKTISDLRAQGTLERLTRRNALGPGPRYGAPKPENAAEPAA
jgi:two-component system nitrogen regulation response regulator NtrX